MKKSEVYRYKNAHFRYDYEKCLVERIGVADEEMIAEEKEWKKKYPKDSLYGIGKDGYYEIASAGLHRENWDSVETRNEYLDGWLEEMEEEAQRMASEFFM